MTTVIRLDASDLDDIRRMLPASSISEVAEYIGCSRWSVAHHARRMGLRGPTYLSRGPRTDARLDRDIPGVAKVCNRCDQLKPLEDFHPMANGREGRHSHCRKCIADAAKAARARRR